MPRRCCGRPQRSTRRKRCCAGGAQCGLVWAMKGGSEGFGLARALKAATPSLCGGRWWCHELFLKLLGSGAQWGGGAILGGLQGAELASSVHPVLEHESLGGKAQTST